MSGQYNFHGAVNAGAIGDHSHGEFAINHGPISNSEDLKKLLSDIVSQLSTDSSVGADILNAVSYLKDHVSDEKIPSDANTHFQNLKNYGGEIGRFLKKVGMEIGGSTIASWIVEGLKNL